MGTEQLALELQPEAGPEETVIINERCQARSHGDERVVVMAGLPIHRLGDTVVEAYAMVTLVEAGFATQVEVARAFGCASRTVRRHRERYATGGMQALATRAGWRPGRHRLPTRRRRLIAKLREQGLGNCEIARRLGVTEKAIRKQVGRRSDVRPTVIELPLEEQAEPLPSPSVATPSPAVALKAGPTIGAPDVSARAAEIGLSSASDENEAVPLSLDHDPQNRLLDRTQACAGLIDDAVPLFGDATGVPGAGVLFALPLLVASGIFQVAPSLYGSIGPAFYGLRTTLLTLLLMVLLRIKRPEWLKERDAALFGRLLGLDRAPEVKTLRRKLTRLAAAQQATRLGVELARRRVEQRGKVMGFLYVDGHVRVYHGTRRIPKTHVAFPCRGPRITGSTIVPVTPSWWSRRKPMLAWPRCSPPSPRRSAPWSVSGG